MKAVNFFLGTAVVTVMGAIIQPVSAVTMTFDNQSSFQAAAGATISEDFNTFTTEAFFNDAPLDVGDFTLSVTEPATSEGRNGISQTPLFPEFELDGTPQVNTLIFGDSGSSFQIQFDQPITAFGADFGGISDDRITQLTFGTEVIDVPERDPGFFGIVTDTPFSLLSFQPGDGQNDGFSLDNIEYAPVPFRI